LALHSGPSYETLFRIAYEARQGDAVRISEFGDTIYHTLRPAAFEAYQRAHGPHAITYDEWFYSKLTMFLNILGYERLEIPSFSTGGRIHTLVVEQPWKEGVKGFVRQGDWIDEEEIKQTLIPEDNERISWVGQVRDVSAAKTNRAQFLREWLRRQPADRAGAAQIPASWEKNRERDKIISNGLNRRIERSEICVQLDRSEIATTPSLEKVGFHRWVDAWRDPDGRQHNSAAVLQATQKIGQVPSDFQIAPFGTEPNRRRPRILLVCTEQNMLRVSLVNRARHRPFAHRDHQRIDDLAAVPQSRLVGFNTVHVKLMKTLTKFLGLSPKVHSMYYLYIELVAPNRLCGGRNASK
jgi:hypothetical protein